MTRRRAAYAASVTGAGIVVASFIGDAWFGLTAIPAAVGIDAFDGVAVGTALALFLISLVIWGWAFAIAVARSAQGDDVVVANLFVTVGGAPSQIRTLLFGSLGLCVIVAAATAAANPFGVLVPMLPLGFVGLWAARHGSFPARRASNPRQR